MYDSFQGTTSDPQKDKTTVLRIKESKYLRFEH